MCQVCVCVCVWRVWPGKCLRLRNSLHTRTHTRTTITEANKGKWRAYQLKLIRRCLCSSSCLLLFVARTWASQTQPHTRLSAPVVPHLLFSNEFVCALAQHFTWFWVFVKACEGNVPFHVICIVSFMHIYLSLSPRIWEPQAQVSAVPFHVSLEQLLRLFYSYSKIVR